MSKPKSKIYRCSICDIEFTEDLVNDEEALLWHLLSKHFELVISLAKGLIIEEKDGPE
ncbi:MAG: hypothetical protein QXL06_01970 [Nitrososphaerota archaeon]